VPFDPIGWAPGVSPASAPVKSKCPSPVALSWACTLLQSPSSSKPPPRRQILPDPTGRYGSSHEVLRPFSVSPLAAAASLVGFASPGRLRPQVFSTSRRVSIRREPAGLVSCRIRSWGCALQSFPPVAWPYAVSSADPLLTLVPARRHLARRPCPAHRGARSPNAGCARLLRPSPPEGVPVRRSRPLPTGHRSDRPFASPPVPAWPKPRRSRVCRPLREVPKIPLSRPPRLASPRPKSRRDQTRCLTAAPEGPAIRALRSPLWSRSSADSNDRRPPLGNRSSFEPNGHRSLLQSRSPFESSGHRSLLRGKSPFGSSGRPPWGAEAPFGRTCARPSGAEAPSGETCCPLHPSSEELRRTGHLPAPQRSEDPVGPDIPFACLRPEGPSRFEQLRSLSCETEVPPEIRRSQPGASEAEASSSPNEPPGASGSEDPSPFRPAPPLPPKPEGSAVSGVLPARLIETEITMSRTARPITPRSEDPFAIRQAALLRRSPKTPPDSNRLSLFARLRRTRRIGTPATSRRQPEGCVGAAAGALPSGTEVPLARAPPPDPPKAEAFFGTNERSRWPRELPRLQGFDPRGNPPRTRRWFRPARSA
jgi:hypothetical protein